MAIIICLLLGVRAPIHGLEKLSDDICLTSWEMREGWSLSPRGLPPSSASCSLLLWQRPWLSSSWAWILHYHGLHLVCSCLRLEALQPLALGLLEQGKFSQSSRGTGCWTQELRETYSNSQGTRSPEVLVESLPGSVGQCLFV